MTTLLLNMADDSALSLKSSILDTKGPFSVVQVVCVSVCMFRCVYVCMCAYFLSSSPQSSRLCVSLDRARSSHWSSDLTPCSQGSTWRPWRSSHRCESCFWSIIASFGIVFLSQHQTCWRRCDPIASNHPGARATFWRCYCRLNTDEENHDEEHIVSPHHVSCSHGGARTRLHVHTARFFFCPFPAFLLIYKETLVPLSLDFGGGVVTGSTTDPHSVWWRSSVGMGFTISGSSHHHSRRECRLCQSQWNQVRTK
jgi:hypothetical protein